MAEINTGEVRNRLLLRLRECKAVLFVTHKGSDPDNAASIYLTRRAIQRLSPEMAFEFAFVNPGTLISDPFPTGTLVIHLDTGDRYDPLNFVFDHHTKECPFLSATDIVFQLLFDRPPKYLCNLVEYVNRVDTGTEADTMTTEDYQALDGANEMLRREDGTAIGRFVRYTSGPAWLGELCRNRPPGIGDYQHLQFVLHALNGYAEKFRRLFECGRLFDISVKDRVSRANGVRFAIVPRTDVDPSDFRGHLNSFHHVEIDVMVMECYGNATETQGQFAVALLSKKKDVPGVRGLRSLFEKLRALDPDAPDELFYYHHKEWLIYVKPGTKITFERVIDLAKETLYTATLVAAATSFGGGAKETTPNVVSVDTGTAAPNTKAATGA